MSVTCRRGGGPQLATYKVSRAPSFNLANLRRRSVLVSHVPSHQGFTGHVTKASRHMTHVPPPPAKPT